LSTCENIKTRDSLRQAPPEKKSEKLERFMSATPGGTPNEYKNRDHADFGYCLSLFWASHSKEQVRSKLEKNSVNARGRSEYVDRCVSNACIAYEKAEKPERKVLQLAEETASAAIVASWKGGADAIVPPQDTPARTRSLATQALKVMGAHLDIAALAERLGKKNYSAPTEVVCRLAKVSARNVARINKILVERGWLIQVRAPIYHPINPVAGVYQLAGVPQKAQGYQSTLVNRRLEMLHLGNLVITEVDTKEGKDLITQTQHPESIISRYLLPSHPYFDSCPEAWFLWRGLLGMDHGLNANRLSKILKVHRATAGRMLKKLEAAGLVRQLNRGWEAIVPGLEAAPVEAAAVTSQSERIPDNVDELIDIFKEMPGGREKEKPQPRPAKAPAIVYVPRRPRQTVEAAGSVFSNREAATHAAHIKVDVNYDDPNAREQLKANWPAFGLATGTEG